MMSEHENIVRLYITKIKSFVSESHQIFGKHEQSKSRIIILDDTYKKLFNLKIEQNDLFKQSFRCTELGLYRAAHVMGWAAFMDFLEELICSDGLVKLKIQYPNWNVNNIVDLRETINEYQIIEASKKIGIYSKTEKKALHGLLNKRNECAHPSNFYPGLNETLGYLSELLNRIDQTPDSM